MDASLIAILAAGLALVASLSFLRQSFRMRQVRLRLDYALEAERHIAPNEILGLTQWPERPGGIPDKSGAEATLAAPCHIEPPRFALCHRRGVRMTSALALSAGFHAAFVITAPEAFLWISRALDPEQRLVVRFDNAIRLPLILQMPEARRVVFARREPRAAKSGAARGAQGAARPRGLVEPRIPEPARKVENLPSPELPSAAEAIQAPRPERAYRTVSATTLLQPRRPAARKEIVELPAFAAWTGQVPEVPSPQTVPGSALPGMMAAAPPPRRPVLPFPSGVPVRAAAPSVEEPKLALPPPGVPVENPPIGGPIVGSGILTPGEPVSVISISPTPLEPGQAVQIPPVTQVGGGIEEGQPGGVGTAGGGRAPGAGAGGAGRGAAEGVPGATGSVSGSSGGTPGGRGAAPGGAPGGRGSAIAGMGGTAAPGSAGTGSGAAGSGIGASGVGAGRGSGTGAGGTGTATAGSGAGAGTGAGRAESGGSRNGSPFVRQARLGGQLVKVEQWPDGTVVLLFPKDGNFDVVVVENTFPEALSDLAKRLSGRPVYTAFLDVGTGREWTLHYCASEKRPETQQSSMVVTLEDPPPLQAPYIQRAELPFTEEWRSVRYQVFHGYITDAGKLERMTAVRAGAGGENLLKSFIRWEFRPATRSKKPVEIEVLLVIPPLPVP